MNAGRLSSEGGDQTELAHCAFGVMVTESDRMEAEGWDSWLKSWRMVISHPQGPGSIVKPMDPSAHPSAISEKW